MWCSTISNPLTGAPTINSSSGALALVCCCPSNPPPVKNVHHFWPPPGTASALYDILSLVSLIGHSHPLTETSHLTQPGFWGPDRVTEEALMWPQNGAPCIVWWLPLYYTLMASPLCPDSTSSMDLCDLMYQLWVLGLRWKNSFKISQWEFYLTSNFCTICSETKLAVNANIIDNNNLIFCIHSGFGATKMRRCF